MKTMEIFSLLPALAAGIALGGIFFGGLWFTVRKGLNSKMAGFIFLGSLIVRLAIVIVGFYFVASDSWQKMLACLLGFLIARVVIIHLTKKEKQLTTQFIKDPSHEN